MPEPPDFDRIFERIALRTGAFQAPLADVSAVIVEQLRQVWNARGAADRQDLIDPVTNAVDDWVRAGAGTYDELQTVVEQAIATTLRSVDR